MTMKHIQQVEVMYDDGTREQFTGRGVANIISTHAPADKDSGAPGRDYCYLSLTLDLPLPVPAPTPEASNDG